MSAATTSEPADPARRWGVLAGLLLLCVGGGALIGVLFAGQTERYGGGALELPAWAPPDSLFGPVWTVLYALMAVGAWLVWRAPAGDARRRALVAFAVQLVLNFAWTPVFFGLGLVVPGLAVILAVGAAAVWWAVTAHRVRSVAGWLQVPYVCWVGFASVLNGAIAFG